ncbi:MAG: hypothetical protein V4485_04520 [Pseudomonadota bacterium]
MSKSESDTEHSDLEPHPIDARWVKATPRQLQDELDRPLQEGESRKSLAQLEETARDLLWQRTEAICQQQLTPALPVDHRTVYRVHGKQGVADLRSEAEKYDQFTPLTVVQKKALVTAHAEKNRKAVDGDIHSPFVSTTSDLRALVSNTFGGGSAADPSLRNEVFEHADFVSILRVPQAQCVDITQGAGYPEREVLVDTTHGPLSHYRMGRYHQNPFQGQVQVQMDRLARSRGDDSLEEQALSLIKRYNEIPRDRPITAEIVQEYNLWHTAQKEFCDKLISMPKQRGGQRVSSRVVVDSATSDDPSVQLRPLIKRKREASQRQVGFQDDTAGVAGPDNAGREKQARVRKVIEKAEAREALAASLRSGTKPSPEEIEAVPRQGLYDHINKVSSAEIMAYKDGEASIDKDIRGTLHHHSQTIPFDPARFQADRSTHSASKTPPSTPHTAAVDSHNKGGRGS